MSVKIMGQLWDLQLAHRELLLLLAITDHADHDGRNMFPSIDLLAYKTGYSRRTVIRILNALTERGVLERQVRPGKSSVYNINLDVIPKKKPRDLTRAKLTRVKLSPVTLVGTPTRATPSAKVIHEPSIEPSTDEDGLTQQQKAIRLLAQFHEAKCGQMVAGWARRDLDALVEDYSLEKLEAAIAKTEDRQLAKPFLYLRKVLASAELLPAPKPAAKTAAGSFWGRDLTDGE
jgi:hypothetical protein